MNKEPEALSYDETTPVCCFCDCDLSLATYYQDGGRAICIDCFEPETGFRARRHRWIQKVFHVKHMSGESGGKRRNYRNKSNFQRRDRALGAGAGFSSGSGSGR